MSEERPELEPIVDWAALRDWGGFALRAPRRHKLFAALVFVFVAAAGGATPWLLPRTWHVETTLLAQRNQLMPALGNPQRAIPGEADAPTRAASEIVLRRSNLIALVKQANLLDLWAGSRAPALRAKDWLMERFRAPLDEEERLDALVGLLEKKLSVTTQEGTVTIAIDWHDAGQAYQLVDAAQQNFLEARHVFEVSTIAETISILEGRAAEMRDSIVAAIGDVQRLQKPARDAPKLRAPQPRPPSQEEQERAQLRVLLSAKRRAIQDLEDFRRRRLAELSAQLVQQRASYSEVHPLVKDLRESIGTLERESPQIASLKKEEAQIAADLQRAGGELVDPAERPSLQRAPQEAMILLQKPATAEDAASEYARSRLRFATAKYESLLDRIDAARIELDTARAAFKYRYSVVRPAQLPKKPRKPSVPVSIAGSILAGVALAIAAAAARDLLSRRILERWQVERQVGLPLVGGEALP